ncbi:ubiquitin carboxyl-terminal hydrolase 24-like isoform X2 [Hydractinia symbiolongicarpus]|uniref:ubiquitin carboxyl-terminal hydrolase 24-like isoform X2 n=1 Tax=Hydractinia symbiolongicarpus TaxID=13093 RepID=UPI00254ED8C4|nr:ubiquitin carboxyl-terminal hydrolase 24-like isoform X2 [Hydractinia symbiolongicarpus]
MLGDVQPSDEHITMLLNMGFTDIDHVREALSLAKNDLNEAVAILTGEVNKGGFGTSNDVEMKEASQNTDTNSGNNNIIAAPQYGPQTLEASKGEEVIDVTEDPFESIEMSVEEMPEDFPVTNLYELEDRIFTENWSIPYKKSESLAKCLYSAIKLAYLEKAEKNEHCARFMDRVLPECFHKLLCSAAVKKWTPDVHEGVFNMIQLFVDLVAMRLKYSPIPLKMLTSLSQAFDPDSEFHFKNRGHKWNRSHYEDLFGYGKCAAMSPAYDTYKEPFGWLVDLVNRFAYKGGFDGIINHIDSEQKVTASVLASLLKPFGLCAAYLNQDVVGYKLGGAADKVVHYIKDLKPDDMREKEVDKVYDLLRTLHFICESLWPDKTTAIDELHLNTILKMLNLPHFNARMNALKELSRLIKEAEKERWSNITQHDEILKWLLENKVISVAFSSSLHHDQYCEKLKNVVEFACAKISTEELTTIWQMQTGKHVTVVDNIHTIISSASQNFTTEQMEHLITLLEKSWNEEDDKSKERLLLLIGRIGREIRDSKIVIKLLDMLWDVCHTESLPLYLLNQAVQSHLDILTESSMIRSSVKHDYVVKCVQDIKQNVFVVPAIRHMLNNLQSFSKQPFGKSSRTGIQDLQNQHGLLKLLCHSLTVSHKSVTASIPPGTLSGETIVKNMYTYAETVITHLKLVEFLLQEGGLYLGWTRCKEIWDCLMLDAQNCDGDYETCLEWFVNCINDLQAETQKELFVSKILKTDVSKMKEIGFKCFKSYFESVNICEHKIRRSGPTTIIEKQDLTGISYLWQLILDTPYINIAEDATKYLINISYSFLSSKVKKTEYASIHKRFIAECYKRLDGLLSQVKEINESGSKGGRSSKTFKKPLPVKGSTDRSEIVVSIERLLHICYSYILVVEESYAKHRSFPPHGTCFHGVPIHIHVTLESNKSEFDLKSHSNESLLEVRQQIAAKINTQSTHVQIYKSDKLLTPSKNHKLLSQLDFEEKQSLNVKITGTSNGATVSDATTNDDELHSPVHKPSTMLEREKVLPSFIMAVDYKIFDKLYQLAEMEDARITSALQNLFLQLPTDSEILEAIEIFSFQNPLSCSPGTRAGYTTSSSSVLENYFKCSAPKMSTFRVLYNLQVLSSKLMPVIGGDTAAITHSFRENWLNAGGLSLIMNILLPDTLPSNADYELRQSCYYIILQLARFLLCGEDHESNAAYMVPVIRTYGQCTAAENVVSANSSYSINSQAECPSADISMTTSTPIKFQGSPKNVQQTVASSWPGAKGGQNGSPVSNSQLSSSPGSAASFTPENGSMRKRLRSASVLDSVSPTVKMVIENLNEEEFTETISSLVQVAWAASAGQLQLNARHNDDPTSQNNIQESSGDELKAGLCLQQENVSNMDSVLAHNSLELLVMCLQLRPRLVTVFYKLPNVTEFIIDILTGSPSEEVRNSASLHFSMLANAPALDSAAEHPKAFLLNILMKAPLPFWTITGTIRGITFKLLRQCSQYFDLMCNLVYLLSSSQQLDYGINASKLLEDELIILTNSDNINVELLLSHLKLTNVLFTCENVDKRLLGQSFIQFLFDEFLFPASKLLNLNMSLTNFNMMDINVNSYDLNCRMEALNLLLTLSDRCPVNLCEISNQLVVRNHSEVTAKAWDFQPPVSSRPMNGFVGLKNAGATCYMNSILQQLYMQPGLRESLLKIDDVKCPKTDNVFYQLQTIFGHLLESQTQYYTPDMFWKSFKLWGEPVNVREQQDAFEFFINITDQIDENLKGLKKDEMFKKTFSGTFVDQKICQECSHCFERDEPFFSLPVTVKCGNLETSLEQFVHNEIMEGENAYYCEKCCERRTTVKRTCIKTVPPVLVIQLKRFWYDWERNRAIKFDDFFSFPWVLDIEPYTQKGISKRENEKDIKPAENNTNRPMDIITDNQQYYELVGVVVHSGQASAGHYYSFIKNRQNTIGEFNQWYKFNDMSVERFDMTDESIAVECFGGEYKVSQSDSNSQYPESRIRNWNGYMLFYETMDKSKLPPSSTLPLQDPRGQIIGDAMRSYPSSPASSTSSNPPSPGSKDSCLVQLSALIRKGERKGLFNDLMPASIKRLVNEENVAFLRNRDVYNEDYFKFIRQLCSSNVSGNYLSLEEPAKDNDEASLCLMKLAVYFLFNTYLKTSKSFRSDMDSWCTAIETLMCSSTTVCTWFLTFFGTEQGKNYILPYLVECPDKSNREFFLNLLFLACHHHFKHGTKDISVIDNMVTHMLQLLDRELVQNIKQSAQCFEFFYKYACTCDAALLHLSEKNCFRRFHNFLLGPAQPANSGRTVRRWTTLQTQELISLHNLLALLIVNTDVKPLQTGATENTLPPLRNLFRYPDNIQLSSDMCECLHETEGDRFLHEWLYASIELSQLNETLSDAMMYLCWSNMKFSIQFIRQLLELITKVQVNDIQHLFTHLTDIWSLQDVYQEKRLQFCMEGSSDNNINGLFSIIRSSHTDDARRAYQCIKFLVGTSNKLPLVKEYLITHSLKWQWAVDWLKKKMSEYSYWPAQTSMTNDKHASFQRTFSAQNTLAEATKLLTEIETSNEKNKMDQSSGSKLNQSMNSTIDTSNVIIEEEVP